MKLSRTASRSILILMVSGFLFLKPTAEGSNEQVPVRRTDINRLDFQKRFDVEIGGVMVAGVHSVEGLDAVIAKQPKARSQQVKIQQRGSFKMTKDWSNTLEWYDWRKRILDGKVDRKSISIIFRDDTGAEIGRMILYNCYPTKHLLPSFDGRNSGHATEQITLSWETAEIKI
jgi:phage tail-like protein